MVSEVRSPKIPDGEEDVAMEPVLQADGTDTVNDEAPREPFYRQRFELIVGALSVLSFLLVWEWVGTSGIVNPLFTSSPSRIAGEFRDLIGDGTLTADLLASGQVFVVGYGLAVVFGAVVGIMIGWYRTPYAVLNPFITSLYATPRIALMPLMVIWLGIGLWSKVAVVFLGAVFPMLINMQSAMRTLDADLLKAARSFGASQSDIFRTIALPASVPFLISGLKLALGRGLVGVVVAELFAATKGIGYRIMLAGATFQTDQVFVGVLVLIIASLTFNTVFVSLEKRFGKWRPKKA